MIFENSLTFVTRSGPDGKPLPIENRRRVFISYRKKDNLYSIRDRVAECILASVDCAVWYDASLTPGQDYDREIEKALRESDVVVILLTPNILDSRYVWDIEIRQALEQKKGIIPIALGINEKDIAEVEAHLGHMQMLSGECLFDSKCTVEKKRAFIDDLGRALGQFIVSRDTAMSVSAFYAAKKDKLPIKVLSYEQMYLMAFGLLRGLGTGINTEQAVMILDSLLGVWACDTDTLELKGEIAYDLLVYYTGVGDSAQILRCAELAERYNSGKSIYFLANLYHDGRVVAKDCAHALELYKKAAELGCLDAMRMAAKLTFDRYAKNRDELYREAIGYYRLAAEHGEREDFLRLVAAYWNYGESAEEQVKGRTLLESELAARFDGFGRLGEFLENNYDTASFLSVYRALDMIGDDSPKRVCELSYGGHSFYLIGEGLDSTNRRMCLCRDDKKIYEICVSYGFGDISFFDMSIDDGILTVHFGDFDHYGIETLMEDYIIPEPLDDDIAVYCKSFGWKKGRIGLKYTTIDLIKNN